MDRPTDRAPTDEPHARREWLLAAMTDRVAQTFEQGSAGYVRRLMELRGMMAPRPQPVA